MDPKNPKNKIRLHLFNLKIKKYIYFEQLLATNIFFIYSLICQNKKRSTFSARKFLR